MFIKIFRQSILLKCKLVRFTFIRHLINYWRLKIGVLIQGSGLRLFLVTALCLLSFWFRCHWLVLIKFISGKISLWHNYRLVLRIAKSNPHDRLTLGELTREYALVLRQAISITHTEIPQTEIALARIYRPSPGILSYRFDWPLRLFLLQANGERQTSCIHANKLATLFLWSLRDGRLMTVNTASTHNIFV